MNPKAIRFVLFALVLSLCLGFSHPLRAQVAGATLTGAITDAQGGAVANAKVSAKNAATGITTETTTNSSGVYTIVNLNPAEYTVSISSPGFSTATSKVTLTVGARQEMNIPLAVGAVTQTVEITGAAPVIETTNATLSGNVQSEQIVELPLNGRDWASLATLEPGVASVRPHEAVDAPGGSTRGLGVQMTVNGARPQQNVYRLNGVIVNDYSNAGPGNVLGANVGVDAIQEFTVLTSNYSSEYGFTSGGVINAITKSGTNSLHGSLYEFVRNKAFDAADFFDNAAGNPKAPFVRNQFGGSGGWKVLRDRAFVFGDYEGLRQVKSLSQQAKSLTADARNGIIRDAKGALPGAVYPNPTPPPATITPDPILPSGPCVYALTGTSLDGTAMANAVNYAPGVASVCVDNTIAKLLGSGGSGFGLVPLPNGSLVGPDNNVGRFNSDSKQRVSDNYGTARADFRISDKDSLSGSWYRDASSWLRPDKFNQSIGGFEVPHRAYTLEENHIFSSSMVNTLRLGYARSDLASPSVSSSNALAKDTTLGMATGCTAPGITVGGNGLSANSATITGFGGFTNAPGFYAKTGRLQVFDDVSRTAGKHNLKFGFMYLNNHDNWGQGAGCGGSASFTSEPDFLQNVPAKVRMPRLPPFVPPPTTHHYRSSVFAGYAQDDWKMLSNLTVNVGIRYEMQSIPSETQTKINQLINPWQNPGSSCTADLNGVGVCAGFNHQYFLRNPTKRNFEPRVGFAWDPFRNGKTSVRGGFGIFDVLPMSYMFALNSLQTAPNGSEIDLKCAAAASTTSKCGTGSFPLGFSAVALGGSGSGNSLRWGYNEQTPKRNFVMQYNLNIQRQIAPNTSVTLAYTGSRGVHNPQQMDDINTVFPYKTAAGWLFPNPVGSGCMSLQPNKATPPVLVPTLFTAPDCSITVATLGLPAGFSDNPTGIVPGLVINSHTTSAQIQSTIFQAQSWYNSLQVRVDKRMSHGLQVGGSFTWGKSFDTTSSSFAGDNYSNNISPIVPWWDQGAIKGLSDFNVTSNLVVNALWQIPTPGSFSGPAGWIARGWGMGGVLELSSGTPMWTLSGVDGDPMGQMDGAPFAIPDLVPGCQLTNPSSGRHKDLQYINPACFINAQAPSLAFYNAAPPFGCDKSFAFPTCINLMGHLPRNTVIGPGLINVDFSMVKDNHIKRLGEAFNIQFRAEMFNLLNRANFAPPPTGNLEPIDSTGAPVGGFGQLAAPLQAPNREIQFALKVVF
jgi:hypothetical protein